MTTYSYSIEQRNGVFRVTEADGPNAPASGEYETLEAAKDAVLKVSGLVDLDWEHGETETLPPIPYWHTAWDAR